MAGQLTIKQIAQLAGVSVGTVDRVLHNRGRVSSKAEAAIQSVLDTYQYKQNLHTSAVAFKKTGKSIRLVVAIPFSKKGEYWDMIQSGVRKGLTEYADIPIDCRFAFFDPFNSLSCKQVFENILSEPCSAALISPIFVEETRAFCQELDRRGIPFGFVDGRIDGVNPCSSHMADQLSCGRLMARMTDAFTPPDAEVAIFLPKRVGTLMSNNSLVRTKSFRDYYACIHPERVLKEGFYSPDDPEKIKTEVSAFLQENPAVKGIAVMISTGYLISDALREIGRTDICVGGFDITEGNARSVREDTLSFVIDQHPVRQGFSGVEALLHYLMYGRLEEDHRSNSPVDVVFKENIDTFPVI